MVCVLKTRASLSLWRRGFPCPPCRTDRTRAEDGTERGPFVAKMAWSPNMTGTSSFNFYALKARGTQHTRLIFSVFCTDWRNLSITRLSVLWVKQGWKWHPILVRNPRQSAGRVALHLCLQWHHMSNACMCIRVSVCVCVRFYCVWRAQSGVPFINNTGMKIAPYFVQKSVEMHRAWWAITKL